MNQAMRLRAKLLLMFLSLLIPVLVFFQVYCPRGDLSLTSQRQATAWEVHPVTRLEELR